MAPDPIEQFVAWFTEATKADLAEPNAMILSTASAGGVPSARTVLLKGVGPDGFRFFTNHGSRKGTDLAENPRAALVFPWHPMHRQVLVYGAVRRLPAQESADYFHSRPRGSQLGAWASERQSSVIPSRAVLEERYAELAERWADTEVPLPDFWGGYLVVPETVEFWQGGPDRLHDRLRYRRSGPADDEWVIERLSP